MRMRVGDESMKIKSTNLLTKETIEFDNIIYVEQNNQRYLSATNINYFEIDFHNFFPFCIIKST